MKQFIKSIIFIIFFFIFCSFAIFYKRKRISNQIAVHGSLQQNSAGISHALRGKSNSVGFAHGISPTIQDNFKFDETQYIGTFDNGGVIFDSDFIKNTQKLHYKEPSAFTNFIEDYTWTIKKESKTYPKY